MLTLDYTRPFKQITPTVDYTEVVLMLDTQEYLVVKHDWIVLETMSEFNALQEYKARITAVPIQYGDYR